MTLTPDLWRAYRAARAVEDEKARRAGATLAIVADQPSTWPAFAPLIWDVRAASLEAEQSYRDYRAAVGAA